MKELLHYLVGLNLLGMIKIKDIPCSNRPREKAYKQGIKSLSDVELLALLISSGTKNKSAIDLAYELINRFGSIEGLSLVSIEELEKIEGIKKAKAIKLLASFELIRRFERELRGTKIKIDNVEKAMKLLLPKTIGLSKECLFLILLNENFGLLRVVQLYIGTSVDVSISPKDILQEVVKSNASKIYIAHNHPSNNIKASKADHETTRMLYLFLESFSITIIDSLVIGNAETYSIMTDCTIRNDSILKS